MAYVASTQEPRGVPLFRTLIAADINGYGGSGRGQLGYLKETLYQTGRAAFAASRLSCGYHREDRGDGFLVVLPPDSDYRDLLSAFPVHLCAEIDQHNERVRDHARLSLRLAVHAGFLWFDDEGVGGHEVNHLHRLLEAPAFKAPFRERAGAAFGMVVSDYLYENVVRAGTGFLGPGSFQPIEAVCKETAEPAWTWFPPSERAGGENVLPLRRPS